VTTRAKKPAPAFETLSDCDDALRRIALLDIELEKIEGDCNWVIAAAKRDAERAAKSKVEQRARLVAELELFFEAHKRELTHDHANRTVELLYGQAGWRLSPPALKIARGVKIGGKRATWAGLVALVKEKLGIEYVRVEESVKKDEIKAAGFDDDELLAAGLAVQQDDEWWFEVDRERVSGSGCQVPGR
jgi:phage host-nuclease inhibitor protein Gam